jgi:hypothetical protein
LAGEDAVKAAGEKYLPRLDAQTDEDYSAYKARASFFGATARTLAEYLDVIFRRVPVIGAAKGSVLRIVNFRVDRTNKVRADAINVARDFFAPQFTVIGQSRHSSVCSGSKFAA